MKRDDETEQRLAALQEFRAIVGSQAYAYVPIGDRSESELKEIAEQVLARFASERRVRLGPIEMSFESEMWSEKLHQKIRIMNFIARCIEVLQ